jgi:hypothetical protein
MNEGIERLVPKMSDLEQHSIVQLNQQFKLFQNTKKRTLIEVQRSIAYRQQMKVGQ